VVKLNCPNRVSNFHDASTQEVSLGNTLLATQEMHPASHFFRTPVPRLLFGFFSVALFSYLSGVTLGLEPTRSLSEEIEVLHPKRYQVFQRRYDVPQLSHPKHPGGPANGFAEVLFELKVPRNDKLDVFYRIENQPDTVWMKLSNQAILGSSESDSVTKLLVSIPAGGWYRVEFRFKDHGRVVAQALSEPFGVGEIFIVAGQSYATNCNDEKLKVADPMERVVALDTAQHQWRVAHDPQPAGDSSDGGSIWPSFGDLMVHSYNVPIGLVNVAVGGTSTRQWSTDGELFHRLLRAGAEIGDFRAVLWQQGESDVIEKTPATIYVERLKEFRRRADQEWGEQRPWLLAKSTLHPTVYNEPADEANIRRAIEELIAEHGFVRGPDTDRLDGLNRGDKQSRRHFTGLGQRNAAAMWFASVWQLLETPKSSFLQYVPKLAELNLRVPAWKSPIVYHESAVLIQEAQGLPTARLAFPASEVLKVRSASRWETFEQGKHWRLDPTESVLEWVGESIIEPIRSDQRYVPTGSPNSYKHRIGKPEESLLYAPGKWFHERNIEITYRPKLSRPDSQYNSPSPLEATLAKLRAKSKVVLAISGDSISTGLDASATTVSFPNQAGYPELVAAQLTKDFGATIELVNRSVAGWSIANGLEDLDKLLESKPDLLVVAYGMNDVGRRDPVWFADQAKKIQLRAKERLGSVEILWVAPMLGNKEWVHTPRDMFFQYRDALKQVVQAGESFVDLTEIWAALLDRKNDLDLTGNGLNHPNDFGHRLYAQAILEALQQ